MGIGILNYPHPQYQIKVVKRKKIFFNKDISNEYVRVCITCV